MLLSLLSWGPFGYERAICILLFPNSRVENTLFKVIFQLLLFYKHDVINILVPAFVDTIFTGTAQDLPTHRPGTRVWTQVCGGGGMRHILMVFMALTGFPHGVFLSNAMYGIRRQPPVDPARGVMQLLYHGNCQHLHCARYEFLWTLQYFCILQGQLLFVLWQLLWIHHISCRVEKENFSLFHWTLQCLFFSSQSQLLPPRHKCGSLAWEFGLLTNRLAETAELSIVLASLWIFMS